LGTQRALEVSQLDRALDVLCSLPAAGSSKVQIVCGDAALPKYRSLQDRSG
jgi:hypothetical protein